MTHRVIASFASALGLIGLCSIGAHAQVSEGIFVGAPVMTLVDDGTQDSGGTMSTGQFHRKLPGFDVGWLAEGPGDAATDPVFTGAAMFGGGTLEPPFRVNAFSIGQDYVFANIPSGGVAPVTFGPESWGALMFSVSRSTSGEPGSRIATEVQSPGGAGADLFSYIPNEAELPLEGIAACLPRDQVQRAVDALEMDFTGAPEIAATELFAPLYETGEPVKSTLYPDPSAYFSVAQADLSMVPTSWFGATLPSAATILTCKWNPVGGFWSTPNVFLSYDELGLLASDDIDALAVDEAQCLLLFSVAYRPGQAVGEQLQVAWWDKSAEGGSAVETGTLTTGEGAQQEAVAARLELAATGDIDGVCTDDPGSQTGSPEPLAFGEPYLKIPPPKLLASNIYRNDDDVAGPELTFVVSGVPEPAPGEVLAMFLEVFIPSTSFSSGLLLAYLEGLGAGTPPTRTYSFGDAILASPSPLGAEFRAFWIMAGGPGKKSSLFMSIDV